MFAVSRSRMESGKSICVGYFQELLPVAVCNSIFITGVAIPNLNTIRLTTTLLRKSKRPHARAFCIANRRLGFFDSKRNLAWRRGGNLAA